MSATTTTTTTRRWRLRDQNQSRIVRAIPAAVLITDLLLIVGALALAAQVRDRINLFGDADITSEVVGWLMPAMTVVWISGTALLGGYEPEIFDTGMDEFKIVFRGGVLWAATVGIGCYLFQYDLSRGFFVLAFVLGTAALILGRLTFRRGTYAARRRGHLMHKVLIAGSRSHADELALNLQRERRLGYQVTGVVTPAYDVAEKTRSGISVLGDTNELARIAIESGADVVFIAGGAFSTGVQLKELVWALEHHQIQLVVAPSLTDVSGERVRFRPVDGLPLIHVDGTRAHYATRWSKRTFDVVSSLILIVLLSPLLAFAAARIKFHDGGPVLFSQTRIGKDGVPFQCLKFRTMVPDAESLVENLQAQQGTNALMFKMKDDPRITAPGMWLRRYSVDEVPQLFNVLRGNMSLVGPRPQVQREVDLYEGGMVRRLRVRPGMTGLWQVSGRSDLTATEAMRLDLYYVDNWSMFQDVSILARTVGAVMNSSGAY
ncbi:sugar transferase [Nocardioides sp. 616]|uniref:sugar transferase n=1 Tax=Nocardioides sp. 616 TaxID=2268090 RepID=UPI0013B3C31F|nr:sugar transferase [Nocardioides sp. 616]